MAHNSLQYLLFQIYRLMCLGVFAIPKVIFVLFFSQDPVIFLMTDLNALIVLYEKNGKILLIRTLSGNRINIKLRFYMVIPSNTITIAAFYFKTTIGLTRAINFNSSYASRLTFNISPLLLPSKLLNEIAIINSFYTIKIYSAK